MLKLSLQLLWVRELVRQRYLLECKKQGDRTSESLSLFLIHSLAHQILFKFIRSNTRDRASVSEFLTQVFEVWGMTHAENKGSVAA
ncbi:hypothetical protein [Microcoleus sp. LEGE 07076]|uniref:hypothetical protein n=1 Tax=Microcoleus sp. LEGE 07076 TaxID=915322 RepID=UPI001D146ED8|nr:hypothetical protein [Microcoleus sp. LEGE 07076]